MKKLLIIIILAFIWGYFQSAIFPLEKYGYLYIFTAMLGGGLIGLGINKIIKD